jgi:Ni,Fe-hydrogenase III small subunit/NAD-dependent dihydropyrimidine dehydrogenase PreA subunit
MIGSEKMSVIFDRLKHKRETISEPLYENNYSYGRIITDEDKCSGCGECQKACAVNAINVNNKAAVVDNKKCIYCYKCIDVCSRGALYNSHDYKMADMELVGEELRSKIYGRFKRSLVLRSVDTGSCNACMLELSGTQNTYYALSRFGIDFAASPRHSDGIVVTGPVAINMKEALLKTYYAMSEPRLVIAVGACAHDGGIFKNCYGNTEELSKLLPVDLTIPGCPPSPQAIIYGLLKLIDRL